MERLEKFNPLGIMNVYVPRPRLGEKFTMRIRPGCYDSFRSVEEGILPNPEVLGMYSDDIFVFRDDRSQAIRAEIKTFWESKDKFQAAGFLHKRGLIIYGPPASGKTCLLKCEVDNLVSKGHVVLFSRSPYNLQESIKSFRKFDPERELTVIIEDIDEVVRSWGEHSILEMLDGMDSTNHVLFIATTNNLEDLSSKMKRPGRFDRKIEVPYPSAEYRKVYLDKKMGGVLSGEKIKKLVDNTDGMSFGHLREITVSMRGYGCGLSESVERIRQDILEESKSKKNQESPLIAKCLD